MTTNYAWASALLTAASLPNTANNVNNVTRWMAAEEPSANWWHNNDPLNVNNLTEGGQESFPSLAEAMVATAAVLRQDNMKGIYYALAGNQSLEAFSAAVVASPWAASHYGGDPNHIAQIPLPPVVNAPGTPPTPTPSPSPPPTKEPIDMIASTPSGNGYWVCKPDGSIWSYGDAQYLNGLNYPTQLLSPGDTATGFTSHPTQQGYWISTASGAVFAFGAAGYHGGPNVP